MSLGKGGTQVFKIVQFSCTLFKIAVFAFKSECPQTNKWTKTDNKLRIVNEIMVLGLEGIVWESLHSKRQIFFN